MVRGEVVPDCVIDVRDLVRVTAQYKTDPPFHPACSDQDGDGLVGLADVVLVAASYGRTCPTPWEGPTGSEGALLREDLGPAAASAPPAYPVASDAVRPVAPGGEPFGATGGPVASRLAITAGPVSGLFAWRVELAYQPSAVTPLDSDPHRSGVQPFDVAGLPAGAWVVENRAEPTRHRLHLAVSLISPAPPLHGEHVIADLPLWHVAGDLRRAVRVVEVEAIDREGRRLPFGPRLIQGAGPSSRARLWLPRVGR
jgi:hypothetical protein